MENKPELLFSDLYPGRTFRTLEYPITRELVNDFMETTGDRNPLYWDDNILKESGRDSPIAPPGLAGIYARLSYLQDHTMPSGGILAKQEFEFKGLAKIGETLMVNATVIESYIDQKGRKRVTFLIEAKNQESKPVSTIRIYAIWPK